MRLGIFGVQSYGPATLSSQPRNSRDNQTAVLSALMVAKALAEHLSCIHSVMISLRFSTCGDVACSHSHRPSNGREGLRNFHRALIQLDDATSEQPSEPISNASTDPDARRAGQALEGFWPGRRRFGPPNAVRLI